MYSIMLGGCVTMTSLEKDRKRKEGGAEIVVTKGDNFQGPFTLLT